MPEIQQPSDPLHHVFKLLATIRLEKLRRSKHRTPSSLQQFCRGGSIGLFTGHPDVVLREAVDHVGHIKTSILQVPDIEGIC